MRKPAFLSPRPNVDLFFFTDAADDAGATWLVLEGLRADPRFGTIPRGVYVFDLWLSPHAAQPRLVVAGQTGRFRPATANPLEEAPSPRRIAVRRGAAVAAVVLPLARRVGVPPHVAVSLWAMCVLLAHERGVL